MLEHRKKSSSFHVLQNEIDIVNVVEESIEFENIGMVAISLYLDLLN